MRGGSRFLIALLVGCSAVLVPGVADAHASLAQSTPQPGQALGTAPGVVQVSFTELLNPRLSEVTVVSPTGQQFSAHPRGGEISIQVPTPTNATGVYRVSWTTVSLVDGHTLHGSFEFGVGVAPGSKEPVVSGLGWAGLALALVRAIEYLALLTAVGMLVLGRIARRPPAIGWVRPKLHLVLWIAPISGCSVIAGEVALAASGLSIGAIASYLSGAAGIARIARVAAEALGAVASYRWRRAVAPLLGVAVIGIAAAGHAAAVHPKWLAEGLDAVHLVSAGVWAGGILALSTLRPPGGWKGEGRALLERFSPVAIPAFAVTLMTGVLRGFEELHSIKDLVLTAYGLVLLVKVVAVIVMTQLSLLAWRRITGSVRLEAAVACGVVIAAAMLTAFPLPPRAAAQAEAPPVETLAASALPRQGDLTLGSHAGEVLVGLTVRPAEQGEHQAFVYLMPLYGASQTKGLPVQVRLNGEQVPISDCGPTCREATFVLKGDDQVSVVIGTKIGGTANFEIPRLPLPDGQALLARTQQAMHALSSYRMSESLTSGIPGYSGTHSEYSFLAPNRMQAVIPGRSEAVWIGKTRYLQTHPHGKWQVESGGPPIKVPSLIWDGFAPYMDARILGTARIGGVSTKEIAFYGTAGGKTSPVWLKLWVDDEGLVRRSTMFADGHFMTDDYSGFNSPVSIEPPAGAS